MLRGRRAVGRANAVVDVARVVQDVNDAAAAACF